MARGSPRYECLRVQPNAYVVSCLKSNCQIAKVRCSPPQYRRSSVVNWIVPIIAPLLRFVYTLMNVRYQPLKLRSYGSATPKVGGPPIFSYFFNPRSLWTKRNCGGMLMNVHTISPICHIFCRCYATLAIPTCFSHDALIGNRRGLLFW